MNKSKIVQTDGNVSTIGLLHTPDQLAEKYLMKSEYIVICM